MHCECLFARLESVWVLIKPRPSPPVQKGKMIMRSQTSAQSKPTPTFTLVRRGLLQRKCACGGTPGATGECEDCRRKRLSHERTARNPESGTRNRYTVPPQERDAALGVSWDFTKSPVFAPDLASRPQALSPLSGVIQPELVVGRVDDPLEREADRIANQVMRIPESGFPLVPFRRRSVANVLLVRRGRRRCGQSQQGPCSRPAARLRASCTRCLARPDGHSTRRRGPSSNHVSGMTFRG
jgi:hypothetical protein